ncbi:MAG: hydrogenase maturation protease [Candidatus Krumholzibacteria bacterium]|nr:hydrogenase maturation protease [Candidatus Krumholzibacteria bacterium]
MKTVIIGLGNTVLSDDGAGVFVARMLSGRFESDNISVIETESAGMNLMEMLGGYDRAFLIDAILLNREDPGTVFRLRADDLQITPRLSSCHDIDIVTALELGRQLGIHMPEEVMIFAIQGDDMKTLREGCTPNVESSLLPLADEIEGLVKGTEAPRISIPLSERKNRDA